MGARAGDGQAGTRTRALAATESQLARPDYAEKQAQKAAKRPTILLVPPRFRFPT